MKDILKGLKIGIGICIPLVILVFASLAIAKPYFEVQQSTQTYNIPKLDNGMGYEVKLGAGSQTCVDLENQLGLYRGAIQSISTDEQGNITVNFAKNQQVTDLQMSILEKQSGKPVKEIKTK
jgi:hypothetical protein